MIEDVIQGETDEMTQELNDLRSMVREQADIILRQQERITLLMSQFRKVTGREAD